MNLSQNGKQTEVDVLGSGQLNYHVIRLENPDRLVLDFAGSHLETPTKHIASNLDPIREIRLAQFAPDVSRIVIDLQESGISAPSTTRINGDLAIRAAITNHRTDRSDIDALVDAILAIGRALTAGIEDPELEAAYRE